MYVAFALLNDILRCHLQVFGNNDLLKQMYMF